MKSAIFQKDGYGAVCGKLIAPDVIVFSQSDGQGGKVLVKAKLSGNVVETEYNDVIILGQLLKPSTETEMGVIDVQQMESLYATGPIKQYRIMDSDSKVLLAVVIPREKFQEAKRRTTENGNTYTEIKASGGDKKTVFIKNFGDYEEPHNSDPFVFLCKGMLEKAECSFRSNEVWSYFTGLGNQMEN